MKFGNLKPWGGRESRATSINNKGLIVGAASTPDGSGHGVVWDNDRVVDLGTLEGEAAAKRQSIVAHSIANAINDDGLIAGYSTYHRPSNEQAVIWENGKITNITGDYDFRIVNGINSSGQAVGYAATYTKSFAYPHAIVWDKNTYRNLNPKNSKGSVANAINRNGLIVGYSTFDGTVRHATQWVDGSETLLDSNENVYSEAFDINDNGVVVGHLGKPNSPQDAVQWVYGKTVHLPKLKEWGGSLALSINTHNQIVGCRYLADTYKSGAVLWVNGNAYELNSLIDPSLGWKLDCATSINDSGAIVGRGVHNGKLRGFLLTPRK